MLSIIFRFYFFFFFFFSFHFSRRFLSVFTACRLPADFDVFVFLHAFLHFCVFFFFFFSPFCCFLCLPSEVSFLLSSYNIFHELYFATLYIRPSSSAISKTAVPAADDTPSARAVAPATRLMMTRRRARRCARQRDAAKMSEMRRRGDAYAAVPS